MVYSALTCSRPPTSPTVKLKKDVIWKVSYRTFTRMRELFYVSSKVKSKGKNKETVPDDIVFATVVRKTHTITV